jgi:hypothetical protein|nr:MAG TPA: hypothetical protein [Caudoviricetes sp.]
MAVITEIKTNLTRISKAKADIISAITAKGGTVASGAKIEDLPACIRAIPTGGGGEAVEFVVKSSVNVVAFTKDGQTPVGADGEAVALTVNVGDMLVICVASQRDYFNVEGGSGYKELGLFPTARRMYVYWILIEEAGGLMLS